MDLEPESANGQRLIRLLEVFRRENPTDSQNRLRRLFILYSPKIVNEEVLLSTLYGQEVLDELPRELEQKFLTALRRIQYAIQIALDKGKLQEMIVALEWSGNDKVIEAFLNWVEKHVGVAEDLTSGSAAAVNGDLGGSILTTDRSVFKTEPANVDELAKPERNAEETISTDAPGRASVSPPSPVCASQPVIPNATMETPEMPASAATKGAWNFTNRPRFRQLPSTDKICCCIGLNQENIVTGMTDGDIIVYDRDSLESKRIILNDSCVICFQFRENFLISCHMDRKIRVWCLRTGIPFTELENTREVWHMKWKNSTLITGSANGSLGRWTTSTTGLLPLFLQCNESWEGHCGAVLDVDFDEKWIVSMSLKEIKMWDATTRRLLRKYVSKEWTGMGYFDGKAIAYDKQHSALKIWDVNSGVCVREIEDIPRVISCIRFHLNYVVIADVGGKIRIWKQEDVVGSGESSRAPAYVKTYSIKCTSGPVQCEFAGDCMVSKASTDCNIFVWDFHRSESD